MLDEISKGNVEFKRSKTNPIGTASFLSFFIVFVLVLKNIVKGDNIITLSELLIIFFTTFVFAVIYSLTFIHTIAIDYSYVRCVSLIHTYVFSIDGIEIYEREVITKALDKYYKIVIKQKKSLKRIWIISLAWREYPKIKEALFALVGKDKAKLDLKKDSEYIKIGEKMMGS